MIGGVSDGELFQYLAVLRSRPMDSLLTICRLTSLTALMRVAAYILVLAAGAARTWAQESTDMFVNVGTLVRNDGRAISGPMALDVDTVLVGDIAEDIVYVFTRAPGRDDFQETATLTPGDGGAGFGNTVAVHSDMAVVGAEEAAYVFRRAPGGSSWQEVAKLTGDVNPDSFAHNLGVSGGTIVVSAPWLTDQNLFPRGPGLVYVFERDAGGQDAWGEVARLFGIPTPPGIAVYDSFGSQLAIDHDSIIVGALFPTSDMAVVKTSVFYVFSRDDSMLNPWPLIETRVLDTELVLGPPPVAISGDVVVGVRVGAVGPNTGHVFERDRGGPNAWGEVTTLRRRDGATALIGRANISGDLVVAHYLPVAPWVGDFLFARNQGGNDAWGEVGRIAGSESFDPSFARMIELDGDTLLIQRGSGLLDVFVADTDRDGLRDGVDPCPRDPLNNAVGGCQRASFAHPIVDDLLTLEQVTGVTQGDEFIITATFTNNGNKAVRNPFFEVTELTSGNALLNSDAGPGGTGATLSPNVGDGLLSAGESMTTDFVIALATREPFQFRVSVRGDSSP
jgi:hypothetical protein